MSYINFKDDPRAILCHFNSNHDPKNGRFTKSRGIIQSIKTKRAQKQANKKQREEEKAKQAADRAKRIALINESIGLSGEFEATKEGKQLALEYEKLSEAWYESLYDFKPLDASLESRLYEAEKKYLTAVGEYVAKQMISKHGAEEVSKYNDVLEYKDVSDLIKKSGEEYYYVHRE